METRGTRGFMTAGVALAVVALGMSRAYAAERTFAIPVENKTIDIGAGLKYDAWTFGGTVPGPVLRVRQGDHVKIDLVNNTDIAHGIDIHAARVAPNKHFGPNPPNSHLKYEFTASDPGVFVYHCSAPPIVNHIANGMYGMMIVDPKNGWRKAHEVMITEGELYGDADDKGKVAFASKRAMAEQPDFFVFNGEIEKFAKNPIQIKVGELVRVFFANAGPNKVSTFHVIGTIFDAVYRTGNPGNAVHGVQSFEVGPANAAVFEFRVNESGDYPFVDHSIARPYKGAIGVFHAVP